MKRSKRHGWTITSRGPVQHDDATRQCKHATADTMVAQCECEYHRLKQEDREEMECDVRLYKRARQWHIRLRSSLDLKDMDCNIEIHRMEPTPRRTLPHHRFRGFPVEPHFNEEGYNAFYHLDFKPEDIVALTFAKCGTTFLQKTLYMLTRLDDTGNFAPTYESAKDAASFGQVYLDYLHHERGRMPSPELSIQDMLDQPSPRIFSTHLRPELQPPKLAETARIVYMLRNPKDAYVSLHHMLEKMHIVRGGWLGRDDHDGSYSFYMEGNYFEHLKAMQTFMDDHAKCRILVLYYEDMVTNFDDNLTKLAAFLDIPLSDAKRQAVTTKTSFAAMQSEAPTHRQLFFRKGGNGDWKNYVDTVDRNGSPTPTADQWRQFDVEIDKLQDLPVAQPLFQWMD
ncbi:hypothetical protein AC1031_006204 [Aphanomyces cochlioides]|nr:hypothetical protein AC1031_006204 [Aphanomyces cochlioides]